jgi:2-amino-4-hydroxy-6-hydroxymethyldihydropteridine diphosphokinase
MHPVSLVTRRAYLSLGSNIGDRARHLAEGLVVVAAGDPYRVSGVYETEPVGGVAQDDFWNLVVELTTSAGPRELLERCQEAEASRGRERDVRWGPRTLDADVLLVGDLTSDDPEILIPHPRLYERNFVLVPLRELAPDLVSEEQLRAGAGRVAVLGTLVTLR